MSLFLDLIVVAVFVISLIVGIVRGFFRSIMGIVVLIASVALAWSLSTPVGNYLSEKVVDGVVTREVDKALDKLTKNGEALDFGQLLRDMPNDFVDLLERFDVDVEGLIGEVENTAEENVTEAATEYIAKPVADMLSRAIAFVVLFLLFMLVLSIVVRLLNIIFKKIPLLNGANRLLGAVFGGVRGLIFAWGISLALCFLLPHAAAIWEGSIPADVIEGTVIVKLLGKVTF
jgi:uncharacterized membrane protein required for colicin V production